MNFAELLEWQWKDYARSHRNKTNLLIHIVAVPAFVLAALKLLGALLDFALGSALLAVAVMALAMLAQGRGHALEDRAPEPFKDGWDVLRRIAAEQFVTFPRFVLSGGWKKNLDAA